MIQLDSKNLSLAYDGDYLLATRTEHNGSTRL